MSKDTGERKVRMTFLIEESLWREFSIKCAEMDKSKGEILRKLIEKWVRGEIDA